VNRSNVEQARDVLAEELGDRRYDGYESLAWALLLLEEALDDEEEA
jgi:hypothetical protein